MNDWILKINIGKNLSFCFSEQFFVRIEGKLPASNTRAMLPEDQRPDTLTDGELGTKHTQTHYYKHTVLICCRLKLSLLVSQRRRAKRTRLTLSHGKRWSVSPSWSLTPSPRRSNQRRRLNKWPEFKADRSVEGAYCRNLFPFAVLSIYFTSTIIISFYYKEFQLWKYIFRHVDRCFWIFMTRCICAFTGTLLYKWVCFDNTNVPCQVSLLHQHLFHRLIFSQFRFQPWPHVKSNLHFLPSILYHFIRTKKVPCSRRVSLSLFCWSKPVFYECKQT